MVSYLGEAENPHRGQVLQVPGRRSIFDHNLLERKSRQPDMDLRYLDNQV
ncbi:10620_t:CDS:2 [Funneliformis mosseae]|uniref:10620_t:CDS:1 n=1 Tax=Funneliformis mosseae TaxID=27381 RepID=A0A9N9CK22_FUNMO|nr:10620_t:CDS:2 [Funneliformis mosseae]